MLVLSRRINERILIDGEITVTVLGVQGQNVRLGVSAPNSVGIRREELNWRASGNPVSGIIESMASRDLGSDTKN